MLLLFFPWFNLCLSLWLNACLPRPPAVVRALPDLASAEQCQAVHKLVSVRSGSARPGPTRVLILGLSEDPALNSSCNTGKCSNWGIFWIINSDEQPSHSPSHLPLKSYSLHLSLPHFFVIYPFFIVFFFLLPLRLPQLLQRWLTIMRSDPVAINKYVLVSVKGHSSFISTLFFGVFFFSKLCTITRVINCSQFNYSGLWSFIKIWSEFR